MSRRTEGPEEIYIFGIHYLGGTWLGKESEDVRWSLIEMLEYNQPHVHLSEFTRDNYEDFFNQIRFLNENLPEGKQRVEGIVLKRSDSRLLGNIKACKKNPAWFKVKWRDGASGYTPTF